MIPFCFRQQGIGIAIMFQPDETVFLTIRYMTKTLFPHPSENRSAARFSNPWKTILLLVMIVLGSLGNTIAQKVYANNQMSPITSGPCSLCAVRDPDRSVDQSDLEDYSTITIPAGTYDAYLGQLLVFPSLNANGGSDSLIIRLGASLPSDLEDLYKHVFAETFNDVTTNEDTVFARGSNFRIVDENSIELVMKPTKIFNRVKITLSSVNGTVLWDLRVYSAYRKKAAGPDANGILYVKKGRTGGGGSWSNATGELGAALKLAEEDPSIKQIWVAGGTYHPMYSGGDAGTTTDARTRGFLLKNNIKLYGGFAGTETSLSQRDLSIAANKSILSGDMEDNDPPTGLPTGEFILHTVIAAGGDYLMDGFTVMRGYAGFPGIPMTVASRNLPGNQGGGIAVLNAGMEISNCAFKANIGTGGTAAIFGDQANLVISNTLISGNLGYTGVAIGGNNSSILVVNSTVCGNSGNGQVIMNTGSKPQITNSIIYGNMVEIAADQALVTNSIVRGGYAGAGNSGANPVLVDAPHYATSPNSGGDYTLQPSSPAINAGDNSKIIGVDRTTIDPASMADELIASGCSGLLCSVVNPELAKDAISYSDYALLNIPVGLIGVLGTAQLDLAWAGKTINHREFVGFVISQNNLALDATLLGNVKIVLYDALGNELQSQNGFTSVQTTTLNGQTVNYIGITANADAAYARIHLTQLVGLLTSIRVHGAFIWPAGLSASLSKDLAGNPRTSGTAVDMGAYEIQMSAQTITVSDITKTYGDANFEPGFSASSGLTVSYASANNSIAEAYKDAADNNKWKIRILKAGTVTITASQAGNGAYFAAPDQTFDLSIGKKSVTLGIRSSTTITKVYDGNTNGTIAATDLEFASGDIINSDEVQASLSSTAVSYDNKNAGTGKTIELPLSSIGLTGNDAGNYVIGNSTVLSFSNASITPAHVSITANAQTKVYGEPDPGFTYTETGLIGNDLISGSLSRDAGENAGAYDIRQGTFSAGSNYSISFTSAKLTITKATQTITWAQANLEAGCDGTATVQLLASSNSGLPITYTVANTSIATVNGDILTPVNGGATTITASQPGDQNHSAATTVVKDFKYSLAGAIRQQFSDVLIFDNSSGNYVQWQWYKNGNAITGATKAFCSESAALNGAYHVVVTDRNGNSVEACPLTASGSTAARGIKVNPNPAKAGSTITVTCNYNTSALVGARLLLTTASGSQVQQITNVQPVIQLTLPATSGLYVITLVLQTGEKASVNVLSK
ncbi:hypothetical protein EV199_2317 [Pseudobacter ginsenosidimutans]|uniref:Uncharacterized protein n=2 Tax=Pseudobacter ginsenosidimutans TaxID=661488 RepID=A0A4Q7N5U4_9BACT|nr:hypothetical protein EV199_2317 [Pseudobacter ginsenosidimutans]